MSTNTEAKKHPSRTRVEDQTKRHRRVIKTTLGDLIAAVTDEVMPFIREAPALYPVVSCIINDVLARQGRRVHKWSRGRYSSYLSRVLA